jgi:hypothetical protein
MSARTKIALAAVAVAAVVMYFVGGHVLHYLTHAIHG